MPMKPLHFGAASEPSGVESKESGCITLYNFKLNLAVFAP